MDYEKAYKEALKRAKAIIEVAEKEEEVYKSAITIFPELRESEDERIREEIISIVKSYRESYIPEGNYRFEDCIAWLEKQKEPELSEDLGKYIAELSKQFPEVSFAKLSRIAVRVKNWLEKQGKETSWKPSKEEMDVLYGLAYITNQYDEYKEEVITRLYQDLKREFFNGSSYENMFPTYTSTEDDVRRRSTIQVLEYARSLDAYNQFGKADIDKNIAWLEKQGTSYTKRDVDDAFVEGMAFAKDELEKQSEQKHDWSAEDMSKVQRICKYLDEAKKYYADINEVRECMEWLKSLKDRVQPQPDMVEALRAEYEKGRADTLSEMKSSWSEEDEVRLQACLDTLQAKSLMGKVDTTITMWLKSLKDRYTWRPSNEQIDTLEHFVRSIGESGYASPYDNNTKLLYSLLEQLKKLKA